MKNSIIKVLFTTLLAIGFVTQAQANPWWPLRTTTQVKTVQLALPSNNGGVVSVTVPSKTTSAKPKRGTGLRRTQDSTANLRDDERIAADLERHF
jgi:hypothetical protein